MYTLQLHAYILYNVLQINNPSVKPPILILKINNARLLFFSQRRKFLKCRFKFDMCLS